MSLCYEIGQSMTPVPEGLKIGGPNPTLCVLNSEEFESVKFLDPDVHQELDDLEAAESNYVEIFSDYLIGSFAIPDKENPREVDPDLFSFYLDSDQLIFIDDGQMAEQILNRIYTHNMLHDASLGHCLLVFFRELIDGDLIFLGGLEDEMEDMEEAMLARNEDIETSEIIAYRRLSMRLGAYYQQIAGMATLIAENENGIMDINDARAFSSIVAQADRLISRTETLKEYSIQLRELYQTRIDLRQNSIMQIFTIVTVLFAPLTLVTSWFGMNLEVLPGINWPFMWLTLICVGALMLVVLLWVFKKKKWM